MLRSISNIEQREKRETATPAQVEDKAPTPGPAGELRAKQGTTVVRQRENRFSNPAIRIRALFAPDIEMPTAHHNCAHRLFRVHSGIHNGDDSRR